MLRGDESWCQLFSEPGRAPTWRRSSTRAVRDGDEWVIDGQKVWTSSAHTADWGLCLARTDPDAPKHAGITYFLVDMHAPGVDVRPLRQIDGAIHFNEVFLDGVRVPHEHVLGDVGDGWRVATTTLTAERTAIGGGGQTGPRELIDLARRFGRDDDPTLRQELARLYTRQQIQRWVVYRVRTAVAKGVLPGPEASILKLLNSHQVEHVGSTIMSILGPTATLWHDDAPDGGFWNDVFLFQWSSRIGGGTENIQRNIISERVLGLPREPDPSRAAPGRTSPGADDSGHSRVRRTAARLLARTSWSMSRRSRARTTRHRDGAHPAAEPAVPQPHGFGRPGPTGSQEASTSTSWPRLRSTAGQALVQMLPLV